MFPTVQNHDRAKMKKRNRMTSQKLEIGGGEVEARDKQGPFDKNGTSLLVFSDLKLSKLNGTSFLRATRL